MIEENILFGNVVLTFGVGFITWIIIGGFAYFVIWGIMKNLAYPTDPISGRSVPEIEELEKED
jgi:NhaP-type Na+/H+ or K+/H+ antiporter